MVTETAATLIADSRLKLNELATILKPELSEKSSKLVQRCEEGTLGENLPSLLKQFPFELIIMGGRSGGRLDHLLTGSETRQVINNATCPVLIVPADAQPTPIRKTLFATNFNTGDLKALRYLLNWSSLFDFNLELAHVNIPGVKNDENTQVTFRKAVNALTNQAPLYHEVGSKQPIQRLNGLSHEIGANLLALTHYHHDFWTRLWGNSSADQALNNQHLPLLIFPPAYLAEKR